MVNINQVWPDWNEDCVLGEGSFGKVFRAKRVEYGRTFYSAVKVIKVPKTIQEIKNARAQGMSDADIYNYFQSLVENLLNEITLMENLKGAQNIVSIDDYKIIEHEGEIGWDIFIRMELLTPFDSFVSNPDFSQKDVIKLGVDLCTALEVCERNYIIHRDIKPDNIFISRFGEFKLGDFGIARKLETTQANLSRKGTLNYMAPEVYKGEEYGSSVDIYSLGLVLYTLLNNNRIAFLPPYPQPITYKDNEEALAKRLSGMSLELPCNASRSLGETIIKACAYRPEGRYKNATEFKNALINEWNVLIQSGDVKVINNGYEPIKKDIDINNTTNDMTARGKIVVDEYSNRGYEQLYQQYNQVPNYNQNSVNNYYYGGYSLGRSNKTMKILTYPTMTALIIYSIIMFTKVQLNYEIGIALTGLMIGIVGLVNNINKVAIGGLVSSISIAYILEGATQIFAEIQEEFPINAILVIISGLLAFSSGIAIMAQKEVRLGGALLIYSVAIESLFNIYRIANDVFKSNIWHVYMLVVCVVTIVWTYGYDSQANITGAKKAFKIILLVIAVITIIINIVCMINYAKILF